MLQRPALTHLGLFAVACSLGITAMAPAAHAATTYLQTNLTSDIAGMAANRDANLKNPWGLSFGPTTPFWSSDQGTSVATLYNANGSAVALVVPTQPSPTGTVFNGSSTSFALPTNGVARFLFDSLSGSISGWNTQGSPATVMFTATDGAVYTGLAIGNNGTSDLLYAADNHNGKVDVFNSSFAKTTVSGSFSDPNLPTGFVPYGIQNIGGNIYVQYVALDPVTHRPSTAPNTGLVDEYDSNGHLLKELVKNTHLDSPWGITLAPASFGQFGGDILVGNFGDGTINAFDPNTGAFMGTLDGPNGSPLVNSGLWSLQFRAAGSGFDPNALFFTSGINNEADGLFGEIQAVPEPATLGMLALGGLLLFARRKRSV
jgi:uncharacterized protein (TIGR03118 family)